MNTFIIDLTHGGVKIAIELSKLAKKLKDNENNSEYTLYETIYAYDLYNTLKEEDKLLLQVYNIIILKDLEDLKDKIANSPKYEEIENTSKSKKIQNIYKNIIINPIHSSLDIKSILKESAMNDSFEIITHHEGVKLILENWKVECDKQDVKCIELTGVKGKTSTSYILKDIFESTHKDILLLSSLGAHLFKELGSTGKFRELILQKNISITPASILNTVELAKKIANPKCSYQKCDCKSLDNLKKEEIGIQEYENNPYSNLNYEISIFESSLGNCGLGDIGILTNIVENYSIAKGTSNAKEAKKQVFKCPIVVIEEETLNKHYPDEKELYKDKINTFSLDESLNSSSLNNSSNVFAENIGYGINETKFTINYNNLKTIEGNLISGTIHIKTFAPGKHHIYNVLAAITTALALNISEKAIKEGLSNFKGIPGRSSRKVIKNSQIIEEINPGINTKAIESSINMIKPIEDYYIIIGGKYGITCEEIDEEKLSKFLNNYLKDNKNLNLILTDELGESIKNKLDYDVKFIKDPEKAQEIAINENKNILFIYRSNYSQTSKR